jgi:hypothetical protein
MSEYQVEKQKVSVTIFLVDGQTRDGVIFLSPYSSFHSGPQTLFDLMSEEEPFVPFVGNDGSFLLINKVQISHLKYQKEEDDDQPVLGTPLEVTVSFTNSRQLSGTVVLEVPEGKSRLIDFMNSNQDFFGLSCDDGDYVVNPNIIIEIALNN